MGIILRRLIRWEVRKGDTFKPHLIFKDVRSKISVYLRIEIGRTVEIE